MSKKMHWAYTLYEEFRTDYEALQVAHKEEILAWIQVLKNEFKYTTHEGNKKTITTTVQTDNFTTTFKTIKISAATFPQWTSKLPHPVKSYVKDIYNNFNTNNPHPPHFIRIWMAKCALLLKRIKK